MAHLKLEKGELKIEVLNVRESVVKKMLVSIFAHIEGGSFVEKFETFTDAFDERPNEVIEGEKKEQHKEPIKNFIKPVDGIRTLENGVKEYKTFYSCSCGHTGTRYIEDHEKTTTCHKCKSEMNVTPIEGGPDKDFNYFVAY